MGTFRAAVIGLGSMGKNHARHYFEMEDVELVAIADPDWNSLSWFSRRYPARTYTDHREMIEREQPDLISVTVPTWLHRPVALDVIEAGIHLIVEKPIALYEDEALEIIERAEARGVKLTVGHVERFNPVVRKMKEEIERNRLGKIFKIQARRQSPYPIRIQDVGVVIDLAPHDIDIMRFLLNDRIDRLYAEIQRNFRTDREDVLACFLRFSSGVLGQLEVDWITPTTVRELRIVGEKGMFVANYLTQELYFFENGEMSGEWDGSRQFVAISEGEMHKYRIQRKEPLRLELEDFVDAIRNNRPPLVEGEDGFQALCLARAILESGLKGTIVHPDRLIPENDFQAMN
ncbi:MAG: Gfo/Idh/MocA family oxidoreductase [candidate division KSB1 bacterium]|nr:Gfo/Idh/MocA family oxidoreductase [candidate division KSB1 bacterium]